MRCVTAMAAPTSADQARAVGVAGLMAVWPVRSLVANTAWVELFEQATRRIDVLVYAGFRLSETPPSGGSWSARPRPGSGCGSCSGEPDSPAVRQRGEEEGIGEVISAKIQNCRTVIDAPNTAFGTYATTLNNSIYRARKS